VPSIIAYTVTCISRLVQVLEITSHLLGKNIFGSEDKIVPQVPYLHGCLDSTLLVSIA